MTNKDMEEIKEVINCDADAEIKCKMISNILTAKPHYFKEQESCEDCINEEAVIEWLKAKDIIKLSSQEETAKRELKALSSIKPQEPKTDILDKIRAEIKEWYWQADKQALAKDACVVDSMVDLFIRTIDKYKAEKDE